MQSDHVIIPRICRIEGLFWANYGSDYKNGINWLYPDRNKLQEILRISRRESQIIWDQITRRTQSLEETRRGGGIKKEKRIRRVIKIITDETSRYQTYEYSYEW